MSTSDVRAQTASQIVPPTFAPNIGRGSGIVIPGVPGLSIPAGADKLHVRLSGVAVTGGLPELASATAALVARLSGRTVSGAEIFTAARELEAAYAAAGYALVRVVLPQQRLVNGARLKLVVVDGYIERIETNDLPEQVRARITTLLAPLTGQRGITMREIERRVLLAGDVPGVIMRSTLAPGKGEGATVLVIEAKHQAVSETLAIENTLAKTLGTWSVGLGLDLNSVFGAGELAYLRAAGDLGIGDDGFTRTYPRNRTLAAGFITPLWIDGLIFNAEYTDSRTAPFPVNGVRSSSTFERLSLRLRYAWWRGRSANFNSELAFDAQNDVLSLFLADSPVELSKDRLRILRVSADGDVLTPWGAAISSRATTSFGIDGLGARNAADATAILPLSRQGADASFQKFEITLNYNQALVEHLSLAISARSQYAFNAPMLRSEQISIANTSGLSSFDTGSVVGDQGYVVRTELQSPWTLPLKGVTIFDNQLGVVVAPYIFGAYGELQLLQPTVQEAALIRAASYGGGLRLGGGAAGTISSGSLTLEYGRAERSNGAAAHHRFTLVSAFRF